MEDYKSLNAKSVLRELDFKELQSVSGGHWIKHVWRFVNLYFIHSNHTDKDESEK